MHELPQLGKLEAKWRDDLVVIGVQSPKYTAERDAENLKRAVERYEINHPVVNDPDNIVWDAYAVSAWPTLVFVSPGGHVIGRHAGEATFDALDRVIQQIVDAYRAEGSLVPGPVSVSVTPFSRPVGLLSFPGKVLATEDRVFVADSGHHRILVTDLEGVVQAVVGDGTPGMQDGTNASARFNRPQGMAFDNERQILYVADSENHAVRAVDLGTSTVTTVAGTGRQATARLRRGLATETDLSSPWDVALGPGGLYIAMAGTHQIWLLDLSDNSVSVWAGTGHEALRDGAREQAWMAQPMGLCLADGSLYVSSAEAQAVQHVDIVTGLTTTLVGLGLFTFGDVDGQAEEALLQHNQGVAVHDGVVYVADTYNNKIKAIDQASGLVSSFIGSGQRGTLDGPRENARLDEPSGLSIANGNIYIADTNNHMIRMLDFESQHLRTFRIGGMGISATSS